MRKGTLAIASRALKGSGGVAFLLLFLLAALSNAHATTTLTPATVTASPASPTYGATVTLTASLSGWVSAAGGTITFETSASSTGTYGTTLLTCGSSGTVTAAASVTCATTALPLGTTYVKAVYATSATGYAGGTSASPATVTVTPATLTPATVTASPASPTYGATVTLTANLSGWVSAAGGTITFETSTTSGGTYGTTLLTCGSSGQVTAATQVTCAATNLPVGSTYVKAMYAPTNTTDYAGATSAAAGTVTVVAATPTISISNIPGAGVAATGGTFTPTIAYSGNGSPTFTVASSTTPVCTVASNVVTFTSAGGTCSLKASATATTDYAAVTEATAQSFTVLKAQAALSLTGVPMSAQAYGTSFTVASTGGSGTGSVTYSASGSCSNTTTSVTMTSGAGLCSVTVTKAADTTYASLTSSATVSATTATQTTLSVTGVPVSAQAYLVNFTVGSTGGSGTGLLTYSASGSCSNTITSVTMTSGAGLCSVTVTKAADTNYASATSSPSTVSATTATQATLTVTGVPASPQAYGTSFTVGSTGGSGTGLLTYSASGSCSNLTTTVTMGSGAGTCSVTASKAADTNYASATSSPSTVSATTATLNNVLTYSSAAIVAQGTSVTLTATVTPSAVASGTVNFQVGGTTITGCGAIATTSGVANCVTSSANSNLLPAGSDSLTAIFAQGPNTSDFSNASPYPTGSNSIQVNVTPTLLVAPTTPSLPVAATFYYGASVTLNVSGFSAAAAGGTVSFLDGANPIATCTLNSSGTCTANQTVSSLSVATHTITATYTGGSAPAATTPASTVNVIANPTIVALSSTAPYVTSASSITLTANVTTADGITVPGGHVTFYDSNSTSDTSLGQGTVGAVTAGQVTLTLSPGTLTTPGTHYILASYGGVYSVGVAQFGAGLSPSTKVLVASGQTINFTALPASPTYGASVPLVATSVVTGTQISTSLSIIFAGTPGVCTASGSTLTYVGAGSCTVTASQAGNSEYASATASQTVSVSKATQTISHWYNGSTVYGTPITLSAVSSSASDSTNGQPIVYTVTGGPAAAGVVSGTTVTPTGAGTITITAALAGNADYTAATSVPKTFSVYPKPLTITAPSPTASVSYPLTFGSAIPAGSIMNPSYTGGFVGTDTAASLGTVTCTTNYAALPANAPGTYKTFCYGASNPNYDITLVDGSFTLTRATPTPATLPTAATATTYAQLSNYPLSGGSATGAFGSAIGGSYSWTNPAAYLSVGSSSPSVTFKPTDTTDYNTVATTINISGVTAANPAVSWPTASAIPSTSPLSASTLNGGSTNGTFAWTTPGTTFTTSGVYSENVTFSPYSADYNSITHNINVTVTKGASAISCWPTGTTINYGTKLSLSTLGFSSCPGGIENAGDTPGSFNWTSPNTIPAAGVSVSESVTFTPSDTVNFSSQAHTTTLTVNTVNPTVNVWPTATAITYPAALSTSTLRGGSSGGTFAWTAGSTIPTAGTASYSVTFTPTGPNATDYNSVTNNIPVLVYQATATVSVNPTAEPIRLGEPLSSSEWLTPGTALDVNSSPIAGTFAWTNGATLPGVGTSAQSVTFTPTDSIDYTTTTVSVNITVNPCGYQDGANFIYASTLNFFTFSDSGTTLASPVLDAETTDESAVCAVDASAGDNTAVTITYPTITSGATASIPADSSAYGTNAAVLAYGTDTTAGHGATITIQDDGSGDAGSIMTNNANSAGVFASMGGAADISNNYVITVGNYSPALAATNQGALTITTGGTNGAGIGSVMAATNGNNSPVLATGTGGGKVTSTGGVYSSIGTESAGIHASGAGSSITLNGDTVMAQQASAVELNGNSSVTSTGATTLSGALGDAHGIFLYYDSTPGDATVGASSFTMTQGSILYTCDATQNAATCAPSSPTGYHNSLPTLFSVANTTTTITLTDVAVFNTTPYTDVNLNVHSNGNLLTASALTGLGTNGSNGGSVTFNANGEALTGDIIVDSHSTVNLSLAADTATPAVPSTLLGTINGANSGATTVSLTLDAVSTWVVTGDSYLTSLTNAVTDNSNITCYTPSACHVYVWQNASWVAQPGIN